MLIRDLPFDVPGPAERRFRGWVAALLRGSSRALAALAASLLPPEREPSAPAVLEFHAEAGAPEGALYVDGQLVGHVLGVSRL
jgi:hypothetical protein